MSPARRTRDGERFDERRERVRAMRRCDAREGREREAKESGATRAKRSEGGRGIDNGEGKFM